MSLLSLHQGCCLQKLREMPEKSVQMCVTSPPYFGLRDYGLPHSVFGGGSGCDHRWAEQLSYTEKTAATHSGDAFSSGGPANAARLKAGRWRKSARCELCGAWRGQLGLEESPALFVEHLVEIFAEVRRVLKPDGIFWLNLGDSYMPENRGESAKLREAAGFHPMQKGHAHADLPTDKARIQAMKAAGIKRKDLIGIPWMAAFALRSAGWWLRSEVIWDKPNPMPESVTDRPTKSHEQIFLFTKSERYFYNAKAIEEPQEEGERTRRLREQAKGMNATYELRRDQPHGQVPPGKTGVARSAKARQDLAIKGTRNKRTVWRIPTCGYKDAHFATFPPDLIRPCILAGSRPGDAVLDPFGGSGTSGMVAIELGRRAVLIEASPEYCELIKQRTTTTVGLGI